MPFRRSALFIFILATFYFGVQNIRLRQALQRQRAELISLREQLALLKGKEKSREDAAAVALAKNLTAENLSLQNTRDRLQDTQNVADDSGEIARLKIQIKTLKDQLKRDQSEWQELKQQRGRISSTAKVDSQSLEYDRQTSRAQILTYLQAAQLQLQSLRSQWNDLKRRSLHDSAAQAALPDQQSRVNAAEAQVTQYRNQLSNLDSEAAAGKNQIQGEARNTLTSFRDREQKLREDIQTSQAQIRDLEAQLSRLQSDDQNRARQAQVLQKKAAQQQQAIEATRRELEHPSQ